MKTILRQQPHSLLFAYKPPATLSVIPKELLCRQCLVANVRSSLVSCERDIPCGNNAARFVAGGGFLLVGCCTILPKRCRTRCALKPYFGAPGETGGK